MLLPFTCIQIRNSRSCRGGEGGGVITNQLLPARDEYPLLKNPGIQNSRPSSPPQIVYNAVTFFSPPNKFFFSLSWMFCFVKTVIRYRKGPGELISISFTTTHNRRCVYLIHKIAGKCSINNKMEDLFRFSSIYQNCGISLR